VVVLRLTEREFKTILKAAKTSRSVSDYLRSKLFARGRIVN
jgi:hypothetical protein